MRYPYKIALGALGGAMALGALPAPGAAQTQIGGMATIKLSDPEGGSEPLRVQRQLLRTWPRMESCENQKMSFIGFHIGQVEGFGLVTPSGKSPLIEVESVECFTIRE